MVISPMVMNLFISKVYLVGSMHYKNILEYTICHLFHLVIQFYEALKHDSICSKCYLLVIYPKEIIHRTAPLHC